MWVNGVQLINEPTGYVFGSSSAPTGTGYKLDFLGFGYQLENGLQLEHRYIGPVALSTQRIVSI
jgi:hypothetical protein